MGCQEEIAADIVSKEADYVLSPKENHGRLYEDFKLLFDDLEADAFRAYERAYDRTANKSTDGLRSANAKPSPILSCCAICEVRRSGRN